MVGPSQCAVRQTPDEPSLGNLLCLCFPFSMCCMPPFTCITLSEHKHVVFHPCQSKKPTMQLEAGHMRACASCCVRAGHQQKLCKHDLLQEKKRKGREQCKHSAFRKGKEGAGKGYVAVAFPQGSLAEAGRKEKHMHWLLGERESLSPPHSSHAQGASPVVRRLLMLSWRFVPGFLCAGARAAASQVSPHPDPQVAQIKGSKLPHLLCTRFSWLFWRFTLASSTQGLEQQPAN